MSLEEYPQPPAIFSQGNLRDGAVRGLLRKELDRLGAFTLQRGYYARKFLFLCCLFAGTISCMFVPQKWVVFSAAGVLAFAGTQLGFLGHDFGHHQVFRNPGKNDAFGLLIMNLLLGFSYGWWKRKHDEHHANPNHLDLDPDIRFPVVAFTAAQARAASRLCQYFIQYQAFLLIPLLFFLPASMRRDSFAFLASSPIVRRRPTEVALLGLHFAWYGALVFGALDLVTALEFIGIHQAALGFYLGLSFATNHKGMMTIDSSVQLGFFRRQVITSRNLRAGPIIDFIFGPLGTQIEHHIFPDIPRNQLRKVAPTVRSYCASRSIPYHETSVWQAMVEVFSHLDQIGQQLRNQDRSNRYGESKANR